MAVTVQELIPAAEVKAAEHKRVSLVAKMAGKYGLEPEKMMATLKATAFKGDVSDAQMAALLIVADQHGLNPWTKEIYAFPSRNGIVPVVGVDGWARIINEHPQFDGMEFEQDDEHCSCTMYRKDRAHPISVTEYRSECERPTDPWKSHPKRMLRHKAMIQCARIAFAFAGIYDPDEAERVLAAEDAIDVTPARAEDEPASKKISPKRMRKIVEALEIALKAEDSSAVAEVFGELSNEERLQVWPNLRSWERSAVKALLDKSDQTELGPWSEELLNGCEDLKALTVAWNAIQQAYDENGQQPPDDLIALCDERRSALGGTGA